MLFFLYAALFFGLVILIHEAGHFFTAKFFNVKIITFSIGFGKPLVSWKKGETEYRIAFFPLGGFVKMYGDNPDTSDIPEDMKARAFTCKKWWEKSLIAFAGPLCNVLFAMLLLFIVSFFNYKDVGPRVEYVAPSGPAAKAGFSEGDIITKINGESVNVWEDIQNAMPIPVNSECPSVDITLYSENDESVRNLTVTPEYREYKNMLSEKEKKCVLGIAAIPKDTVIGLKGSAGTLKTGDVIQKVNGTSVNRFYEIFKQLGDSKNIIEISRNNNDMEFVLAPEETEAFRKNAIHGGMIMDEIEENSVAKKLGFMKGDLVVQVDGETVSSPFDFRRKLYNMEEKKAVEIAYFRDGKKKTVNFSPDFTKKTNEYTGTEQKQMRWGASFMFDFSLKPEKAMRENLMLYTLSFGFRETMHIINITFKGFWYIISGKISPKSMGGPIMVFDISRKAAEKGAKTFLFIIAAISINLAILNLLPIPALDGGHIMMYSVEAVIGREINKKVKETAITAGFLMLILLMIFVLTNDIMRVIPSFWKG